MKILTAATRNLGISRFLCEYSGPFGGMFSYIWLDMLSKVPVGAKCLSLVRIPRNLLTTPSLLVQSIPYMHTRECLLCIEYLWNFTSFVCFFFQLSIYWKAFQHNVSFKTKQCYWGYSYLKKGFCKSCYITTQWNEVDYGLTLERWLKEKTKFLVFEIC